jgi:signal transduction histidine kinase
VNTYLTGAFATVILCLIMPVNLIATMIERLQDAGRAQRDIARLKSQFRSTISHEIKMPLNAVHGMFKLFERSYLNDRQQKWAQAGLSASHSLQGHITQILDMAPLEEETVVLSEHTVDLDHALQTWATATEAHIQSSKKPLKVDIWKTEGLPATPVFDQMRLQQVMLNLTRNAVRFSNIGSITISARQESNMLIFGMSDPGIGIAPDNRLSVFRRFWQVDTGASRQRDGTGLGLAICHQLALLMGGRLTLTPALGKGSRFELWLPLIRPAQPTDDDWPPDARCKTHDARSPEPDSIGRR